MSTVHVVLGDQPEANGSISYAHKARIETAWMNLEEDDCMLLAGGKTVESITSEAEIARDYLQKLRLPKNVDIELENKSRSTAQNFRFSAGILEKYPERKIVVYCGKAQYPKSLILKWYFWKKRKVEFHTLPDYRGLGYMLAQAIVGSALSLLDPYEIWLGKLALKKSLRKTVIE